MLAAAKEVHRLTIAREVSDRTHVTSVKREKVSGRKALIAKK